MKSQKYCRRFTVLLGLFWSLSMLAGAPVASGDTKAPESTIAGVGPRAEQVANKPAGFLLSAIVTWLSTNFDLPANYDHPRIEFAPAKKIAELRYGAAGAGRQHDVVAVYIDRTRTIFLPQDWIGRTPAQLSVLVHEMVHHLQNLDNRIYDCPQRREKLAYDAQEKWLGLFARSLLHDFEIDALTLKLATACM